MLGLFVLGAAARAAEHGATERFNYTGYRVLAVTVDRAELVSLQKDTDLDIWRVSPVGNASDVEVEVLAPPFGVKEGGLSTVLEARARTIIGNVAGVVDTEAARVRDKGAATSHWTAKRGDDAFFETYRPYGDHRRFMLELAEEHPDIMDIPQSIGKTWEDRDIYHVRVHAPEKADGIADVHRARRQSRKPAVYLQSTVHAREWLATTSLAFTMKTLVEGYGVNDTVTFLLDNLDFYIVPIVNIDGYMFTWENTRLWRKNRRNNGGGSYGVDINRNWGPASTWCSSGSSTSPSSDTYCGAYAFSEPETTAVARFVDEHPSIRAGVDFHTYGPLILWPWQYTYDRVPEPKYTEFEVLAGVMNVAINAFSLPEYRYVAQQGSDLYPHSGGMIDYCFEEHGILAFTFEGRGRSFTTPDSDILPGGLEQWEGIVAMSLGVLLEGGKTRPT